MSHENNEPLVGPDQEEPTAEVDHATSSTEFGTPSTHHVLLADCKIDMLPSAPNRVITGQLLGRVLRQQPSVTEVKFIDFAEQSPDK